MSQSKTIYKVTHDFKEAYDFLKDNGKMLPHEELCKIMGIKTITSLSGILSKRHNIQPKQWQKFKDHFRNDYNFAETRVEPNATATEAGSKNLLKEPGSPDPESSFNPELKNVLNKLAEALELFGMGMEKVATVEKQMADTQKQLVETQKQMAKTLQLLLKQSNRKNKETKSIEH